MRAGMSDASNAAPSCRPSTSGVRRRAATIVSGSSAWTTAMENAPRTRRSMDRVAAASDAPPAISCSMRWAITSVSVAEAMVWPDASSSARSSAWFSMIPLWIRARRPLQSVWGCAFSGVGLPWVAQRVCPRAARLGPAGAAPTSSPSLATESVPPAARSRQTASPTTRATPAESYPRYSSWCSAPSSRGRASASPVTPMMPHMRIQVTCGPAARWARAPPARRRRDGPPPRRPGIRRATRP